jgi:predicted DNA-binding transcriptional regulator YafY
VERSIAGSRTGYEARVTVHEPFEAVAARLPWLASALEPIDAERCRYVTADDDLRWLALRIVMLDAEVEVHEPPELVAMLRGLAARLQRATAG